MRKSILTMISMAILAILNCFACDNQPIGLIIYKEHNHVLVMCHLEELGLPTSIIDHEIKKVLPTKARLVRCVVDAERQIEKLGNCGKIKRTEQS